MDMSGVKGLLFDKDGTPTHLYNGNSSESNLRTIIMNFLAYSCR